MRDRAMVVICRHLQGSIAARLQWKDVTRVGRFVEVSYETHSLYRKVLQLSGEEAAVVYALTQAWRCRSGSLFGLSKKSIWQRIGRLRKAQS